MARMWSILEKVLCALEKKVHSWLAVLWHSLSPLFCGRAQECLGLEVFAGKFSLSFSFFSLSLWLAHFSSLRLSSRHSGPVLTLSNVACASLFSPCLLVVDMSVWATSLLGVVVRRVICGVFFFFFFWLCCPLRFQNSPQTCRWEGFLMFGHFSFFTTPSPNGSPSLTVYLSFHPLYFVLPLEDNGLPFWVPGVLRQHSEVVNLWNLLSVQMIFWWICGVENGLPILFLRHPRTAPQVTFWGRYGIDFEWRVGLIAYCPGSDYTDSFAATGSPMAPSGISVPVSEHIQKFVWHPLRLSVLSKVV